MTRAGLVPMLLVTMHLTSSPAWAQRSSAAAAPATLSAFQHFVTRSGDRLLDGETELRFISFNIPNLHYVEDNVRFDEVNPWRLPDAFEIRDALQSVVQAGGRVARIYTLSVRKTADDPTVPRHVLGPGEFNEEAFRALDQVLQIANETGVRVIIPFVDQWSWWGGIAEYAGFRGRQPAEFWTDPQVVGDFKQTIAFVLNRRNTLTGTLYKDDKAVLAWETGNELDGPYAWTREMAAYIKSLDPNHLVVDGHHSGQKGLLDGPLDDPNIDIVSTHHYPGFPVPLVEAVERARQAAAGRKAYIVGEFGFIATSLVAELLDRVIANGTSGALVWSLRVHNRDGGFYWHSEPAGGGVYKAYHWPGFPSGDAYDATNLLRLLREKAFAIQGRQPPPIAPPAAPRLLAVEAPHAVTWQGSAGATGYDVERAPSPSGPWTLVGTGVDDTEVQYKPLFADEYALPGEAYFYRVRAVNAAGRSEPSNVAGPATAEGTTRVDEMRDASRLFARSTTVRFETGEPRTTKEDAHRLSGPAGASIVYRTREPLERAAIQAFLTAAASDPEFSVSADGVTYARVAPIVSDYSKGRGDYGYHVARGYAVGSLPPGQYFLRITFTAETQIGRVETREP